MVRDLVGITNHYGQRRKIKCGGKQASQLADEVIVKLLVPSLSKANSSRIKPL